MGAGLEDPYCFLIIKNSARRISAPITPDVMPIIYKAVHAGMDVMRYFNEPIRINREADPRNEITRDSKIPIIMLVIRRFLKRFLILASDSCRYSFRTVFISLNNMSMISLKEVN